MSIIRYLRQSATKAEDSLPQSKEARPITVHLSRRSSGVTSGTCLWSFVVKAVDLNPAEKPTRDVVHTPERAPNTVHGTGGEKLQEHYDRAVKGEGHRSKPSQHHHHNQPHIYQFLDPCQLYHRNAYSDQLRLVNPTLFNHTSTNPTPTNPASPTNPSYLPITDAG